MVSCQEEDLDHSNKNSLRQTKLIMLMLRKVNKEPNWHCAKWLRAQLFPQFRHIQNRGGHMWLQDTQNQGCQGLGASDPGEEGRESG